MTETTQAERATAPEVGAPTSMEDAIRRLEAMDPSRAYAVWLEIWSRNYSTNSGVTISVIPGYDGRSCQQMRGKTLAEAYAATVQASNDSGPLAIAKRLRAEAQALMDEAGEKAAEAECLEFQNR
jgi:hypothetical protein